MNDNFTLSVIIPVYNGERFIEKAIVSALQQLEVTEVVVVNDGSTDSTQEIIEKLQTQNPRIKIYHHKNSFNKGRSASRNLGIKKANEKYIAFLDADDFYLKNRFTNDVKIFKENKDADGVYNAVDFHFYRESTPLEKQKLTLNTLTQVINPEKLFEALISGKYGHFQIDGLTVKKEVFGEVGYFNESLIVAEDTELIFKMALKCILMPGILNNPVAKRGIHNDNVFNKRDLYDIYDLKLYESMYVWSSKNHFELKTIERFLERIWILQYRKRKKKYSYIFYWVQINLRAPRLLLSYLGIKYFPLVRLLKKKF
ncbi:MAG: glycosyltransferase family 2 protein [Gelidibacter sp.]|nr:glycosyltransferase family 2 protein [Gelidibacter sp.]